MLGVLIGIQIWMALLPPHPYRVADHNVESKVVINLYIRVGLDEGHQREKTFTAQLPVFGGLNAAEEMVHLACEIAFASCFFQHQSTVEAVASFQLVPNHQAATVLQQGPDAGVEITRYR